MDIKKLEKRPEIEQEKKLKRKFQYFEKLIDAIGQKKIPSAIVTTINQHIETVNAFSGTPKELRKLIAKSQYHILKLIEKELKLVPKGLYSSRWMAIGMSAFGVPFGVAFGVSLGNMAFLAIGIPIGMVIGMAIGAGMDKKALQEGRQLDIELRY